jgi:hypothetical protein
MKTVYSNSELPHIWARQSQDNGRTSNGSMFFDGTRIYSYGHHFCMGDIIKPGTVLLTDRTYSNTTHKHVSKVRYAVNHLTSVYCPHPESFLESCKVWSNRIKSELAIIGHARKRQVTKDKARVELQVMVEKIDLYLETTGNKLSKAPQEFKRLYKTAKDSKATDKLAAKFEKERQEAEQIRKERQEQHAREAMETLELWKSGELDSMPWHSVYVELPVTLRERNGMVETSKGAKVGIEPARVLFTLIQAGKDVKGYSIDGYTVISLNGVLKVGCHEITRDEIDRFAKLMNWI